MEVQKNKTGESRDVKDFDFARQELLGVQEARCVLTHSTLRNSLVLEI